MPLFQVTMHGCCEGMHCFSHFMCYPCCIPKGHSRAAWVANGMSMVCGGVDVATWLWGVPPSSLCAPTQWLHAHSMYQADGHANEVVSGEGAHAPQLA